MSVARQRSSRQIKETKQRERTTARRRRPAVENTYKMQIRNTNSIEYLFRENHKTYVMRCGEGVVLGQAEGLISCVSSATPPRGCCGGSPARPAPGSRTSTRACRCTGARRRTALRSGTRTLSQHHACTRHLATVRVAHAILLHIRYLLFKCRALKHECYVKQILSFVRHEYVETTCCIEFKFNYYQRLLL